MLKTGKKKKFLHIILLIQTGNTDSDAALFCAVIIYSNTEI